MSASPTTLSLTALRVSDLTASTAFYAGCGFVEERSFSTDTFDAVILRAGTAGIELIAPRTTDTAPEHGNMLVKLVLNTSDVVGLLARACAHGGVEEMPATVLTHFAGRTVGKLRDPDGYLIEVVSPPAEPAEPHDR
ncbi:VOC family protein [Nocardia elegans]|uniref:VOC family protein n=1 Tax=Nocardia elegans TaxID=300029 RepID=UPI0018941B6F|nr:VOC family protein [Nocardia elegans]MBF6451155.1 VOC family protein [Nocardia elegans]